MFATSPKRKPLGKAHFGFVKGCVRGTLPKKTDPWEVVGKAQKPGVESERKRFKRHIVDTSWSVRPLVSQEKGGHFPPQDVLPVTGFSIFPKRRFGEAA